MEENQLRKGGPDAPERVTDHDFVGRANKIAARYHLLWAAGAAILMWWSREVILPLRESALTTAQVRLLNVKIDSTVVPWLVKGDADRRDIIRIQEGQSAILGTLARLQCLRTSYVDRAKIDLNCKDIPVEFPQGER